MLQADVVIRSLHDLHELNGRVEFESCFDRGQAAAGFQLDDSGGKYLMEPYED